MLVLTAAVVMALGPLGNPWALFLGVAAASAMGWHLIWQLRVFDQNDPETCLRLFRANRDTGLLVALFLAAASVV